ESSGELQVAKDIAADRVHAEEGRRAARRLDLHQVRAAGPVRGAESESQALHRRGAEERGERQLTAEAPPQEDEQPHREKGVAAQREEIVRGADRPALQELFPDLGYRRFERV